MKNILTITCVFLLLAVMSLRGLAGDIPETDNFEIVNVYPHDPKAFTQGLVFEDGVLFEGTGRYGQSSLRKTELESGKALQIHKLPPQYFGEGITVFGDKVIQLTWRWTAR